MFKELDSISADLWLLPDGVEEILPPEAKRIEDLRRNLLDLYDRWGYQLVFPPLIEFLESLLTGVGQDLDLQTFKITDQATGRMMGIRTDMTPQLARIDARGVGMGAHRVCYAGTVLRTRVSNLFPSRAPVQIGCEIFGIDDIAADTEIISLMLETLETSGISETHLDISHVGIYRHIIEKAGLSAHDTHLLLSAMRRKAVPEVQQLTAEIEDEKVASYLRMLPNLAGGRDILTDAIRIFESEPEIIAALESLMQVTDLVNSRYPRVKVFVDLCELRGFNYHTGLVFAAYAPGVGQAVAQGGRYDGVGSAFGSSRPATGFSSDLKSLLRIGDVFNEPGGKAILAPINEDPALWQLVTKLRRDSTVIIAMPGEDTQVWRHQCDHKIVKNDAGEWTVVTFDQVL